MNTRSAEITVLLEEILKEALQAGITPDIVELNNSNSFHGLGNVEAGVSLDGTIAKSDEINDNLAKIEHYSKVFDTAAGMQIDDVELHRNSFPDRVTRLERWYRDIAYRVDSLVMMVRAGTSSLYTITEAFSSLDNVDLEHTTAYVDTDAGLVRIPSTASSSALAAETGGNNVQVGDAILYDNGQTVVVDDGGLTNGVYIKHTTRSMSGVTMEVRFNVLQQNEEFNGGFLEFDLGFSSHTKIKSFRATSDFKNYEDVAFLQNGKHVIAPVSSTYLDRYISLVLEKENYEGVRIEDNGTIQHQFIFEITNIRLPNRRYKDSASLYSTDLRLPEALQYRGISHLKVMANSTLVTGDNKIDTYVSLSSGPWRVVQLGEMLPIGVVTKQRSFHPNGQTIRELPTPIFKLEGSSPEIVIDQSYLLEGYKQAEVESAVYNDSYNELSHWANFKGVCAYQSMVEQGVYLGPGKYHKIFTVLRSTVSRDITLTGVGVRSQESPEFNQATTMKVIFNGQVLQGKSLPNGDGEYRLSLVAGDNTLNILLGVSGNYGGYMNIGSQLTNAGLDVFVKERAATSLQAILALDTNDKAYAVYNNTVLLNYIPPIDAKFAQDYTMPTASLPQTVAVRFDLQGDGTISPILTGYKIEFTPGSK